MSAIVTTSGLITGLNALTINKMKMQATLTLLEAEISECDLMKKISECNKVLREINEEEIAMKNEGIKVLQNAGIDKFESNGTEVRLKVSVGSLKIEDETKIDDVYKKTVTKVTTSIDKNAIKRDIKGGVIVEGVVLEKKVSLEIKQL